MMTMVMDSLLCDEILMEIFHRLPPPSSAAVPLVSKRWRRLFRLSKTSLSLLLPHDHHHYSLSSFLSHYPFLSSLSLSLSSTDFSTTSFDCLLFALAASCPNLRRLRFLAGPVSLPSLFSLSSALTHLTSLTISLSRPLSFIWVASFPSLRDLSVFISGPSVDFAQEFGTSDELGRWVLEDLDVELLLENLNISGIAWEDVGMGWLWRSCKKLRRLQLRSCQGVGDGGSFWSFTKSLMKLEEVELRTCRTIVDGVLLKLAENCSQLRSLLVYDGGSREGLLRFINNCKSQLQKLDLRLPLDLDSSHLSAMAVNFCNLSSLRLQSCCLVTGEGLKTISVCLSNNLEELALINCDVVERMPGLLTTLGQNLKTLKILDLSYNEMLVDKDVVSMMVTCSCLVDLKLRGCKGLTNVAVASMLKCCKKLESVDIMRCCAIRSEAIESFLMNLPRLRRVQVEESKLSNFARLLASNRFIEVTA